MSTEKQIKDLNEDLQKTATSLQTFAEEREKEKKELGDFMGDTKETLEKMNIALDTKNKEVEELQKTLIKVQEPGNPATPNDPNVKEELQKAAFLTSLRTGGIQPGVAYGGYQGEELIKAMIVSDDKKGGLLAPTEMEKTVLKDVTEISDIRSIATVKPTSRRSQTVTHRRGSIAAKWAVEQESAEENENITFEPDEIPNHRLTAEIFVSNDDLDDTEFDLEKELIDEMDEQYSEAEGFAFVKGDGNKKPHGFMADDRVTVQNNGHATEINSDLILKLPKLIKPTYSKNGRFVLTQLTVWQIRILKDSTNNYIWKQGIAGTVPSTIDGKPYIELPDMPELVAGSCPIMFGDFRGYRISDRKGITVIRDHLTMASQDMVKILCKKRVGGQVLQPYKFAKLKMAV